MARQGRRSRHPFAVVLFEGGVAVGGAVGLIAAASNAARHPSAHPCPAGRAAGVALGTCLSKATTNILLPYVRDGLIGAAIGGALALLAVFLWRLIAVRSFRGRAFVPAPELAIAGPGPSVPPPTAPRRQSIPERVRHEVWRRDQARCVECGGRERLEFDHIIPVSRGGSNTARNIELRCECCNRRKADRI